MDCKEKVLQLTPIINSGLPKFLHELLLHVFSLKDEKKCVSPGLVSYFRI